MFEHLAGAGGGAYGAQEGILAEYNKSWTLTLAPPRWRAQLMADWTSAAVLPMASS